MEQHTLISSNAEGNEIITPVCDNHTTEQPIDLKTKQLPLPLALQEVELTDSDVALLLEIANDPNYPTGRYKGKPKEIPLRENNS